MHILRKLENTKKQLTIALSNVYRLCAYIKYRIINRMLLSQWIAKLNGVVRKYRKVLLPFSIGMLVILIPIAIYTVAKPSKVQAQWWDQGGSYIKRQQLNVVNSSAATLHANTTIAVTVNTKALVDQHLLQADCDDLRVLYQPNNATSTELTRHLVYPGGGTCASSTAAKVYFTLQADLASSGSTPYYYMYYSNSDATSPTSTDNAFDIGSKDALLVCPFEGNTTCAAGETPSTESGAVRYSGSRSALSFDGASDYVTNSFASFGTQGTIETWFKPDRLSGYEFLFDASTSSNRWLFYRMNNTNWGLILAGTDMGMCTNFDSYLTLGSWHHVAITYNDTANTAEVYVNGVSRCTSSTAFSLAQPAGVLIGAGYWPDNYLQGSLDEFRISSVIRYTSAFTPATSPFIRDEYTKLLYHFDENGQEPRGHATNVMAMDDSGNSNHGTITGAKFVSGLVGVDNSSTTAGYQSSGGYASHEGIFIEEGTTNKITNPSFENATAYNTNWNVTQSYALQDEFTNTLGAGSVNGTSSVDGSGNSTGSLRTVTDTNSKLSVNSGGQLSFATGGVSSGNPGLRYPTVTRTAGKVFVTKLNISTLGVTEFGWDNNSSPGDVYQGFYADGVLRFM
ncbi:MAG: laminin G sub protein, partial [uncultured bacterium]